MTVGVNARVPTALPEAGSAASGPQADGESFAQLLTGAAPATADPGDGKADAGAPATALAAAAVQTIVKSADADGTDSSKIIAAESADTPKTDLPAGLGEMVSCLVQFDRLFGRGGTKSGKTPEGAETKDGEASTDKKSDSDAAPIELTAAPMPDLVQVIPPATPAATAAAPIPASPAPSALTAPAEATVASTAGILAQNDAPSIKADDAGTATPLDLSKFTRLAKPVELSQLLGGTPLTDPNAAAAGQPALAAFMQGVVKAAHLTGAKPAQHDAADTAATPSALFSASPLLDASPPLFQPQAALADLQAAASTSGTAAPNMTDLSIDRQLDLAKDGQWVDRLARDIASTAGNEGPLRFRLNPETLGSLHVEVAHSHNGAAIRLTADTEAARAILADAQPRLLAEARAQGVRIAEAHVGMNPNGQQADQRRQEEGRQETLIRTAGRPESEVEQTEQRASAAAERFA